MIKVVTRVVCTDKVPSVIDGNTVCVFSDNNGAVSQVTYPDIEAELIMTGRHHTITTQIDIPIPSSPSLG